MASTIHWLAMLLAPMSAHFMLFVLLLLTRSLVGEGKSRLTIQFEYQSMVTFTS
jgi:hypothetical protein